MAKALAWNPPYQASLATRVEALIERCENLEARATAAEAERDALREDIKRKDAALVRADQFISNGIEFGFIRMPDTSTPDPAHETPEIVRAALRPSAKGGRDGE